MQRPGDRMNMAHLKNCKADEIEVKRKDENGARQGYNGSGESRKLMWNLGAL